MTRLTARGDDSEAWLTFDLPLPVDERGNVRVQLSKLNSSVHERAYLLGQRTETQFLNLLAANKDVYLVFPSADVSASVKIEVKKQLSIWSDENCQVLAKRDLFSNEDVRIQETVTNIFGALDSINEEVSQLARIDEASGSESIRSKLEEISKHPNRSMRSLLVRGGEICLDVDGKELQISAPPTRRVLLESDPLNLEVRLQSGHSSRTSGFDSKVLRIHGIPSHGLEVGSSIRLAHVSGSPTVHACLLLAREYGVPVHLEVKLGMGIETQSLLSAEVVSIKNTQQILETSQNAILSGS